MDRTEKDNISFFHIYEGKKDCPLFECVSIICNDSLVLWGNKEMNLFSDGNVHMIHVK